MMNTIFLRLLDCHTKEETLLELAELVNSAEDSSIPTRRIFLKQRDFIESIPDKPLSYWTPSKVIEAFKEMTDLQSWCRDSGVGIQSGDDWRFLRLWWEVPTRKVLALNNASGYKSEPEIQKAAYRQVRNGSIWAPYFKGGKYSPFQLEPHLVINWKGYGSEIDATGRGSIPNQQLYFLPGIAFLRRTSIRLCATFLPIGCLFGNVSPMLQPYDDRFWTLLAILNSHAGEMLLSPFQTRGSSGNNQTKVYELGFVLHLPVPATLDADLDASVISLNSSLRRVLQSDEVSRHFYCPSTVDTQDLVSQLVHLERKTSELYGWDIPDLVSTETLRPYSIDDLEEETRHGLSVALIKTSESADLISRLSYALGCVLGRWDVLVNTVDEESAETDLRAPTGVCPRGMLQNAAGLPAAPEDVPPDYPLRISWPGILVDDDGHPEDIVTRVREALRVIWSEQADSIEAEACALLGVERLRECFANPNKFFGDHLSRYSKSRRYAPIYWPLTTEDGSYTLWLYYHRLDAGTLYQCVNDFVDPKLEAVERQLGGLRQRERDREEEAELERLTDLAAELETFRKDLLDLASFWQPNLNDGAEITAAPLHALFGYRKWRKRLKRTWGRLQEGEYDWAHLAMSIWPARVVPKCVEDRSLAIAHNLEQLFWVEEEEEWRPLRAPAEEEAHQIEIRQSEERDRLRKHFADLAADEGQYLPAMQIWQSLAEGEWDHSPLGFHLYPERAAAAAFEDATDVYDNLTTRGQKLLQKDTKKNKRLLTKRLIKRGTPELVDAVEATLADEPAAFAALWEALESGARDDLPLVLALWPERVVGKALHDPDLAAHHGLFDFFWYDAPDEGVRRRRPVKREIEHEVERREGNGDGGRL